MLPFTAKRDLKWCSFCSIPIVRNTQNDQHNAMKVMYGTAGDPLASRLLATALSKAVLSFSFRMSLGMDHVLIM